MKKYTYLIVISVSFMALGCSNNNQTSSNANPSAANPFFAASTLPLQVPAFDKITNADFKPAIEEGMRQQQEEVAKIADYNDPPTFNNTVVELEKSGQLLNRVNYVFALLTSANTNPELQKIQEEEAPKLAANNDAIFLNTKLFKRIDEVYNQRQQLKLNPEDEHLLEYYEQKFQLSGANLSDSAKAILKELNKEEATLMAKFSNQLLAAAKAGALVANDTAELQGLSQDALKSAEEAAKKNKLEGKWVIPLQNTTQQPLLLSLANRETRIKLFDASLNRAEKGDSNDTRKNIARLAQIRAQQAAIMGFKSYAEWKLKDQMAENPQAVADFFKKLVPAATAKALREAADIQALIKQEGNSFQLAPYDWEYYAEKVRKAKYNLDESETKPYFVLDKVLQDGVFYAANQLYGLTFKERKDLPVYQEDVRVFDVFDKDGSQLGIFYCDYFKRDNKSGGAWMNNLMGQSKLLGTKPVIYNICNFTKPAPGQPAFISFDDVRTMFHEFGHGLHGLFANQQYPSLASPNTARDFVEFPSQFNEHWALYPTILNHYAVHYQTGAPIPQALVDKIKKAGTFNQGYALTEALAAANLDLQWHTLAATAPLQNVDSFETAALAATKLNLAQVPPRYRSSYFLHIWSNGYAAGYYAYAWTEMLDDDAYAWFIAHGGLTRENGQRFRDMILSRGSSEAYGAMFRNFTGHNPDIQPLLENRGL